MSLMFVYGGRAAGLLWTLAMIHQLGISQYGLYSLGFAVTSVLGQTLNNPYVVRAAREPEEDFVRERASRYLLGVALMGWRAVRSVSSAQPQPKSSRSTAIRALALASSR